MRTTHIGEVINLEDLLERADKRWIIGHEFFDCEIYLPGPMLCSAGTTWHEGAIEIDGCSFLHCTIRPAVLVPHVLIGGDGHHESCEMANLHTSFEGCHFDNNRLVLGVASYGDYN